MDLQKQLPIFLLTEMGDLGLTPLFLKNLFQMKNPPNPKRTRTDKLTKTTTTMFFFLEPSPLEAVASSWKRLVKAY